MPGSVNEHGGIQYIDIFKRPTILIGRDFTQIIVEQTIKAIPASNYVIFTDSNIDQFGHLEKLETTFLKHLSLLGVESKIHSFILPPGESTKTRGIKSLIENWLLERHCTRDSCFIALGGGVVGDLIGFVAATFMRGVSVVQIPTTLLAMVDSSIGGKTAVDTPHGKNLIGSFHQPKLIFIDLKYLDTLSQRQFSNGMAEVIKTAVISSEESFSFLENSYRRILAYTDPVNGPLLLEMIKSCVSFKAHVVSNDEKESGLREGITFNSLYLVLNFGHTIGHGYEAILAPEILHGECVSIGMVVEAEISRNLGHLTDTAVGRIVRCLRSYNLPVTLKANTINLIAENRNISPDSILQVMKIDKKSVGAQKKIVLLSLIGKTVEPRASNVSDSLIKLVISPSVRITAPIKSSGKEYLLSVPGSKSISNRALLLAALGKGTCKLRGLLNSDDVQVMLAALQKLAGIGYSWEENGEILVIEGGEGKLECPDSQIYLGNAGTASRFLTSVCTLIQSTSPLSTILTGNQRMKQRPIGPLVDALKSNGCNIDYLGTNGCLPLEIHSNTKGLQGGVINLSASISSQYVSSILMSAPYSKTPTTLNLTGESVISEPYINMTIEMMKVFGIIVTKEPRKNIYHIPNGVYVNPPEYLIQADGSFYFLIDIASSATYPLAFAALTHSKVTVSNIGYNSLQGDSQFAKKVLREMGCIVNQTETTTTVQGPTRLKTIPSIDMESMTDAFLTASVLAATAINHSDNKTSIYGISNQRVKECNRIQVMIEQLERFGVVAKETKDGLDIYGVKDISKLVAPIDGVECYDDHRVAMSFSLFGCALKDGETCLINEKRCVEKTWPAWWDTLNCTFGVSLEGADDPISHRSLVIVTSDDSLRKSSFEDHKGSDSPSIVLIGMRGVGKTHAGRALSIALNMEFIDMDDYMEHSISLSIADIIKEKGWDYLRNQEARLLQEVLIKHPTRTVISCGGGVVENLISREILMTWCGKKRTKNSQASAHNSSLYGHVIHLKRNIDDVIRYLSSDKTRPAFNEDLHTVWNRRKDYYDICSSSEFNITDTVSEPIDWKIIEKDLVHHALILLSPKSLPPASKFFLSLTFENVLEAKPLFYTIIEGVDAIELRVDLLRTQDDEYVCSQIIQLRRMSRLPIIFTVRTSSQGGSFPDDQITKYRDLLLKASRWGCEYIDIQVPLKIDSESHDFFIKLKEKTRSYLIASYHDPTGNSIWHLQTYASLCSGTIKSQSKIKEMILMEQIYETLSRYGDIIKLIGFANEEQDNYLLEVFRTDILKNPKNKPLIAMNMGNLGRLSRMRNTFMTPVTHPLLKSAAPGQLCVFEINMLATTLGRIEKREFYLFGEPIKQSVSPLLHNTGFNTLALPHTYHLHESSDYNEIELFIASRKSFGGASVTIPLKQTLIQKGVVTNLSPSAQSIGALNTIIVLEDGTLYGDNTDWLGIRNSILNASQLYSINRNKIIGIVLGAGGTARAACYALNSLNVGHVKVWNRTFETAQSISREFSCTAIRFIPELFETEISDPYYLVINTIPGKAQEQLDITEFESVKSIYGVFVEMVYTPKSTPLVKVFEKTFTVIFGVGVLIEQGFEQFRMWTGCNPPLRMKNVVLDAYFKANNES